MGEQYLIPPNNNMNTLNQINVQIALDSASYNSNGEKIASHPSHPMSTSVIKEFRVSGSLPNQATANHQLF